MLRRLAARSFWTVSRWRLVTEPAAQRPSVLIGAPHTSAWDFPLMLAIVWHHGIDVHWLGKESLFRGWRGPLMRGLGGIPVDRANPGPLARDLIERAKSGELFYLVIAPDGTRGEHTYWKTGFYRIAQEAGMPVTLGYVDRATMTTGLGPTIELSGDVAADMERIRAFYADKGGFTPSRRVEPRLRSEDSAPRPARSDATP